MSSLASLLLTKAVTPAIANTSQSFSLEQLLALAKLWRAEYQHLENKSVALIYTDCASFCVGLLAFDGLCSDLFLCSTELAESIENSCTRLSIDINSPPKQLLSQNKSAAFASPTSGNLKAQFDTCEAVTRWWLASSWLALSFL